MKVILFAAVALLAGASAKPDEGKQARIIEPILVSWLEDFTESLKADGLDPLIVDRGIYEYKLPVSDLFFAGAIIENALVEGISEIIINDIHFSLISLRLRLDAHVPRIFAQLGSGEGAVRLGNGEINAAVSGSLEVERIRVTANVGVGILGGISIRDMNINLSVGAIRPNINAVIAGEDITFEVNHFLGRLIPDFLDEFGGDVNELLGHFLPGIIESILLE